MTTDVTEIINAISQALGIVYDKAVDLYPSVVKMNIVDDMFGLLVGIILCIIAYEFLWGFYKRWVKKRMEEHRYTDYSIYNHIDECGILVIVGAFCAIIGFCFVTFSGCDLIKWIVAPDIMSIRWVTDLIN